MMKHFDARRVKFTPHIPTSPCRSPRARDPKEPYGASRSI